MRVKCCATISRNLRKLGKQLSRISLSNVYDLIRAIDEMKDLLSKVDQADQSAPEFKLPNMKILVTEGLLRHRNVHVKLAVTTCLAEVTRITTPHCPYGNRVMKEVFQRIVEAFKNLDSRTPFAPSFTKKFSILETVARSKSYLLMLKLKYDDLILQMFQYFLETTRPNRAANMFYYMETIMSNVLEESEDISQDLISCLLESVKIVDGISPDANKLGEGVIKNCAKKLKPYFMKLPTQSISKYSQVVASLCQGTSIGTAQNEDNVSEEVDVSEEDVSEEDEVYEEDDVSEEVMPDAIQDTKPKEDASIVQSKKDADHCLYVSQPGKADSSGKDEQYSSKEDEHLPSVDSDSKKEADDFSGSERMPLKFSNKKSQREDAVQTPETGHIEVKSPRQTTERGSSTSKVTWVKSSQKQPKAKVTQKDKLKENKDISAQVVVKKTVSAPKYANKSQVEDNLEDGPNTPSKRKRVLYEEFQLGKDNANPKQQDDGHEKEVGSIYQRLDGIVTLIHQMQITQEAHHRFEEWQNHVNANFQTIASNQQELFSRIFGRAPPLCTPSFFHTSHQPRPLHGPEKEVASIYQRLDGIVVLIHQMQNAQQEAHLRFEQWQNHVDANFQTIASNQQELLSRIVGMAPPLPTPSFFNTSSQPRPLHEPEKEVVCIHQRLECIMVLIHQMQIAQQEVHHRFEQWQNHVDENFQTIASNQQELLSKIVGRAPPLPSLSFFNISH